MTRKFLLRVLNLQMSCRELITINGTGQSCKARAGRHLLLRTDASLCGIYVNVDKFDVGKGGSTFWLQLAFIRAFRNDFDHFLSRHQIVFCCN